MVEVQTRTTLWYLVFFGFAVNYMIRINLNITIVDMINQVNPSKNHSKTGGVCKTIEDFQPTKNESNQLLGNFSLSNFVIVENNSDIFSTNINNNLTQKIPSLLAVNNFFNTKKERFSIERHLLDGFNVNYEEEGFNWNEYQQGLVLGSFYWIHWVTQIPGGILAKRYGTKLIFGLSNVIGCWICFLLPIVSYWDYKAVILFRMIQGLICGLAWPAMHNMTAQWIPPNERSKFVTAYLGSSVGIAVFYPLFGYIIAWSSWEWVFHVCGIIGTIWYIGWLFFVFDTPEKHPRITEKERNFIEKSLGSSVQNHGSTPWKEILTSKSVWMNVIAQWGGIWGLFTLMTQAPTYFFLIHGWNMKMTGILSGLPHIMRMLFAYVFSIFGDYLLKSDKMSRTNVRKMATSVCCIVKGIFVLGLAYCGCNSAAAIVFLTIATAVHGAVSTGPLASIVDIAPNYAGIVLGISGMIGVLPGFISPAIVGILTLGNQTITSWKYVFLISSGMLISSGILYVLFCESNLLSWNNPKSDLDKELQLLNTDKIVDLVDDKNKEENNTEKKSLMTNLDENK